MSNIPWIHFFSVFPFNMLQPFFFLIANNKCQLIHITRTFKSFPPLLPANKPDSSRAILPQAFFFLYTSHYDTYNQPWLFALLCSAEIAAPVVAAKHRWGTWTVSHRLFRTHGAQHICYAVRSIFCTNLFVTIHWRRYLSSCHALVAPRCLKNVASHKFPAAWLASRPLGSRLTDWVARAIWRRRRGVLKGRVGSRWGREEEEGKERFKWAAKTILS